MAKNRKFADGRKLSVVCTHPTTPVSGDPVRVGKLAGVALTDERTDGTTTVDTEGVYELNVDDDAATGIVPGDRLYYQDTGTGTPATSVNNNATTPEAVFGIALGTITANGTAKINVRLGAPAIA